jgi:hypothetical protein
VYDKEWYIGNIMIDKNDIHKDFLVTSMRRGRNNAFRWPQRKDECLVALEHMLSILEAPKTSGTGRQYDFPAQVIHEVQQRFTLFVRQHFK